MPIPKFNKLCERCGKNYLTYDKEKNFCNDDCKAKKLYCKKFKIKDRIRELQAKNCKYCGEPSKFTFCHKECKYAHERKERADARALKSREDFVKPKRKGISYAELNRRAEWNLVYKNKIF